MMMAQTWLGWLDPDPSHQHCHSQQRGVRRV